MIILTAEQKVNQQDRDGGAGDYHDAVTEKEETEHVVYLAKPHVVHDEVELDEDGAEGENPDKEHRRDGPKIGSWWRDLSRDLIDADGCLNGLMEQSALSAQGEL